MEGDRCKPRLEMSLMRMKLLPQKHLSCIFSVNITSAQPVNCDASRSLRREYWGGMEDGHWRLKGKEEKIAPE